MKNDKDYSDEIEGIFDFFDKIFKKSGYVCVMKGFEIRKFSWDDGVRIITLMTNDSCNEIHISFI